MAVIYVAPGKDVNYSSALEVSLEMILLLIPQITSLVLQPRRSLFLVPSVIDAAYQGEWHFHLQLGQSEVIRL